jgi:hypothetical protein
VEKNATYVHNMLQQISDGEKWVEHGFLYQLTNFKMELNMLQLTKDPADSFKNWSSKENMTKW